MLMPKANRKKIFEQLFKEGVMVAKKDVHAPEHPELEGIPNLHVIKALQVSRGRDYSVPQGYSNRLLTTMPVMKLMGRV